MDTGNFDIQYMNEEEFYFYCYEMGIYNAVEINIMYDLYCAMIDGTVEEIAKANATFFYNYTMLKTGGFN